MYDVGANVYDSHERIFRNGGISGTRKMREFLYNYVYANDYTFVGIYKTGTNVLQLWIKEEDAETKKQQFSTAATVRLKIRIRCTPQSNWFCSVRWSTTDAPLRASILSRPLTLI